VADRTDAPERPTPPPGGPVDHLRDPDEERPVLQGIFALLGMGLAIAIFAGLAALLAARAIGMDEGPSTVGDPSGSGSMYLPTPSATGEDNGPGPLISVGPQQQGNNNGGGNGGNKQKNQRPIDLSAAQDQVSPMQRIDLTGSYQGGEGAVLQVQRFSNGSWGDFPVTASVSGGTFATYVQTSQSGKVRFRMIDTDSGALSNQVVVRVR
jgi:hypothetical protein